MKKRYLNNYIEEWIEDLQKNLKKSTCQTYKTIYYSVIEPFFRETTLSKIDSSLCDDFLHYIMIKKRLSTEYCKLVLVTLKKIITFYYSNKYIDKDIIISTKGYVKTKNEHKMLSDKEYNTLIQYLIENNNPKNFGILVAIYTGLRIGEICALQIKNIDIKSKVLKVGKTLQRIDTGIVISEPKTRTSIRNVPIPEKLLVLFSQFNITDESLYLLTNNTKPFEPRSFRRYFKKVLFKCNLPIVTFHSLRHGFATRCVELGFDYKSISEILGHASVNTTLDMYVHVNMKVKREYIEKLSSSL